MQYFLPEDQKIIKTLENLGFIVIDPNNEVSQALYKLDGMSVFHHLIDSADLLVFKPLANGKITAGVVSEIAYANSKGIPVLEIPENIYARSMSVEDTRKYLNPVYVKTDIQAFNEAFQDELYKGKAQDITKSLQAYIDADVNQRLKELPEIKDITSLNRHHSDEHNTVKINHNGVEKLLHINSVLSARQKRDIDKLHVIDYDIRQVMCENDIIDILNEISQRAKRDGKILFLLSDIRVRVEIKYPYIEYFLHCRVGEER